MTNRPDSLARLDALPTPRKTTAAITLRIYTEAVAAAGKVTMAQLESAGAFGQDGTRMPISHYRGPLVGLFRQMFNCRLSPELDRLAGWQRRQYMAAYMTRRRADAKT